MTTFISRGACDVLYERQRQTSVEGYSCERDDAYTRGQLAAAACSYVASACEELRIFGERVWPWPPETRKPRCPREDLVRGGALILAEIDRIDRAADRAVHAKAGASS